MIAYGRRLRVASIIASLAIVIGVWSARVTAPHFYELSIYQGTPAITWVALVGIGVLGLGLALMTSNRRTQYLFAGLGASGILSIIWLPMIRGYYYWDEYDAMSGWGAAQSVISGDRMLLDFFYPGLYGFATAVTNITGQPLRWTLPFTALLLPTVSVLFLVAAARRLSARQNVGIVALTTALFFAPLNPLNVMLTPHPSTLAIFFSAFPLAVFFAYLQTRDYRFAIMFMMGLPGLYLFHPQQMINFLLFVGITGLGATYTKGSQFGKEDLQRRLQMINQPPLPVLFAAGVLTIFLIISHWKFQDTFRFLVGSLIRGTSSGTVSGRSSALSALDVSLPVLALKVGAKDLVLGIGILATLWNWFRNQTNSSIPPTVYLFGVLPVVGGGVAFLAVGAGNQLVRYIGMAIMLSVPLAAVGIHSLFEKHSHLLRGIPVGRLALTVLLCLGVLVAVPTFFHAPYTERPGHHVTKGQVESFETVFDYRGDGYTFSHLRSPPFRYHHAINSYDSAGDHPEYLPPRGEGGAPNHFEGLEESYSQPFYLTITRADVERDAELYNGFRYSKEDFEQISGDSDYNRVYDSRHLWVYQNESGS